MHWKLKATLQNAVSRLPSRPSYAAYYWLQRHFGGLRRIDPSDRLAAGIAAWRQILAHGGQPRGARFFEVGTGRVPMTPLAYWLMGAGEVVTIDLNPYLREELTHECLAYLAAHRPLIEQRFGELLDTARWQQLLAWQAAGSLSCRELLQRCAIRYIAPGDAAATALPAGSIDFHTSFNVFEHIPGAVLAAILREGNRLLGAHGMLLHRVDYSDHFSHSDGHIPAIHFLRFSDAHWARYADNRYMYVNRLRHDDVLALFAQAGQSIVAAEPVLDPAALRLLREGRLIPDRRFAGKSPEVLATTDAWIVARPRAAADRLARAG